MGTLRESGATVATRRMNNLGESAVSRSCHVIWCFVFLVIARPRNSASLLVLNLEISTGLRMLLGCSHVD